MHRQKYMQDGTQSLFYSRSFQLWTPVFSTEGTELTSGKIRYKQKQDKKLLKFCDS